MPTWLQKSRWALKRTVNPARPPMCRPGGAKAFKQGNTGCGGQIQAADIAGDGNMKGSGCIRIQNRIRQPAGFVSENEKHAVAAGHLPESGVTVFREEKKLFRIRGHG